jgi:hypothetical protein
MSEIVERIERDLGLAGLVSLLAERAAPTDLQSILLEVYRLRASQRQPAALLADYETNRFVRPSAVRPARLLQWEQIAFGELPAGFQALALSPVCPLGTCSVVAPIDQNWAVSTARNSEVVSDATNVLALECALRRRDLLRIDPKCASPVHLAASHRLLRGQQYGDPRLLSHFSAFVLCSAGRDLGGFRFELGVLIEHARFCLRALHRFLGPSALLRLTVSDFHNRIPRSVMESQVLSPIGDGFGNVQCDMDASRTRGRGYYSNLCFQLHLQDGSGEMVELVDGGAVDWTQKLLSNRKERLVISGIGSERLCACCDETRAGAEPSGPRSAH